ncbi:hypothetical protein QFC24_003439 [Naganishia onofrii]|uniref:Uncharacterized protein n=1 Tax=Naganishia onofrii TaxID=1851511 RepID=A0ACC2XI22_9TREE|nr:hypothetical protein QFC24_003439 [Naganishia onofrii]
MLCAQHCLNNLLQQNLYTAMDLADMATDLDRSENATLGAAEQRTQSQNMDDTGFFSISVLEKALQVFDLSLVRWRSPEMAEFQEHPEEQAAFVLNLASHWLPVRRFASSANRWYNLNSFLQHPEWISPTYLKMVLQQAEQEGYSVFVVRSLDVHAMQEGMVLSLLPECQADLIGLEMGDPTGRDGGAANSSTYASVTRSNLPSASTSQPIQSTAAQGKAPSTAADASSDPDDLVAASLERSRAALERFQREQSAAASMADASAFGRSRRRRQADVPDLFGDAVAEQGRSRGDDVFGGPGGEEELDAPMTEFERRRMREEAELEAAIKASLAESGQGEPDVGVTGLEEAVTPRANPTPPPVLSVPSSTHAMEEDDEELDQDEIDEQQAFDFHHEARLYDDEDAQLQAAINASLQEQSSLPPDWQLAADAPVMRSAERVPVQRQAVPASIQSTNDAVPDNETQKPEDVEDVDDVESEPEVHELTAEELRQKRLERFK